MRALQAQPHNASGNNGRPDRECWNCGRPGHVVPDCPDPRDEARIRRAKEAFFNRTNNGRRGGTYNNNRPPRRAPGQPPRRRFDPRNNVQNRQGAYMLDRQLADAQRRAHQAEQAVVALAAGQATTSTQVNPPAAAMTAAATPALRQARSRAAAAPATSNVNVQSIIRNLVDLA